MLYPSQQEAADLLAARLAENRGAVALQGLSGSGKSTIAMEGLGYGANIFSIDSGMVEWRAESVRDAVARQCRIIILGNQNFDLQHVSGTLAMHPDVVRLKALSFAEVLSWLDEVSPSLSSEERGIIEAYSLGLPFLIECFLSHRPLTRETALPQCAAFLQSVVDQGCLALNERDHELRTVIAEYSDFPIPNDAIALLSDAEVSRSTATPIAVLQSRLKKGSELPVPATLQLYEIYQEWLKTHFDEPNFEVLVQSMPDAETFLETIGYHEYGDVSDHFLKRFTRANARKGATYYPRQGDGVMDQQMNNNSDSLDSWIQEHMIALARSSGVEAKTERTTVFDREVVQVRMPDSPSPMFLHKHDHIPGDVMPVAYTVECALQARGESYTVSYNDKLFRYDSEKKAYAPLERVKVDYYREAYGDLWDAEKADRDDESSDVV